MSNIEIEIDGKKIEAQPNAMVIQVADAAGIYIPRFCYHKHLSIAANCRMCLVEVEKSPKPLPACATPVMPGMKVFTRSPKAIAAQRAVMEFLLINHPLDCPICDQGGECELQDLSMGYGSPDSFFHEGKRSVKDKDIGPLVATEMTRCIQCTRCVRFGDEVAGFRELGAVGRGENMEISTYVTHAMHSEVSGNIIDICPVGALTSKPFRFTARAWELQQFPTIAAHDCIGSNIYVHTRGNEVMRTVPRENINLNQTWISDRDRFSYQGLYHEDRITNPLIKQNNKWQETDWQTALEFAANGLQNIKNSHGGDQLAALASPNSTLEEFYLLQKLFRELGSNNIDHRLRQSDFSDQEKMPVYPGLTFSLDELENCDTILLIGSNIQKEQPIASLRVRKAALKGAAIFSLNMMDYDFHFEVAEKSIVPPHNLVMVLAKIAKSLDPENSALKEIEKQSREHALSEKLSAGKKVAVILGALALNHPQAAQIRALANIIAEKTHAKLGFLTEGANSAGAWIAGAIPHRGAAMKKENAGMDALNMLRKPRRGYVLLNVEPDLDCANPVAANTAFEQAEFIVALSTFKNAVLEQYANVILPASPFTETSGTYVNTFGEWQSFAGVSQPWGESRPAWKILRVLANLLDCQGFEYESSEEVRHEIKKLFEKISVDPKYHFVIDKISSNETVMSRIGEVPIYSGDALVRRANALQMTQAVIEGNVMAVHIHSRTAQKLQVTETEAVTIRQHQQSLRLPVVVDDRVPVQAAWIPAGVLGTNGLSELFGVVEISK